MLHCIEVTKPHISTIFVSFLLKKIVLLEKILENLVTTIFRKTTFKKYTNIPFTLKYSNSCRVKILLYKKINLIEPHYVCVYYTTTNLLVTLWNSSSG